MNDSNPRTEELRPDIYRQVKARCAAGDRRCEAEEYAQALSEFENALKLLPPPVERWEAAIWILTAIGDAHYSMGEFEKARAALTGAMRCPGALGNPFIHLRLGESLFELGNHDRAMDELRRAHMEAGPDIFEDEDPKYLAFLKKHMKDAR